MDEFTLIDRYFARHGRRRPDVVLGVGDDAAVCRLPEGASLVVTTDMLVEGVHFPPATEAAAVGHKALAVNLSDLAAMGADPAWFTLALSLPQPDETWLDAFTGGLFALADRSNCELVGGDTVRGPRTVAIQALGTVPEGQALRRSGAAAGDRIYVTGTLGDAALGLAAVKGSFDPGAEHAKFFQSRLDRPEPRLEEGRALRGIASAAIDISDGLIADLGHILSASGVGARLQLDRIPLSPAYDAVRPSTGWDAALSGGDDYELCFTVSAARVPHLERIVSDWSCGARYIGEIVAQPGLRIDDADGREYRPQHSGHKHFHERS